MVLSLQSVVDICGSRDVTEEELQPEQLLWIHALGWVNRTSAQFNACRFLPWKPCTCMPKV